MNNKLSFAAALAAVFSASVPAHASGETDTLRAEIQRLLQRVEQLESQQTQRMADMEKVVVDLQKPSALETAVDGVSVGASLTLVAQSVEGRDGSGNSQLNSRADVEIELPGGSIGDAEGKLFLHLRAGDGDGVTTDATAGSNATAFNGAQPALMQAFYQLDIPVGGQSGDLGQIEVVAGKMDPFGFFDGNNLADDETEGFLNGAFVHNPLLDVGGDVAPGTHGASPGLRLAYISDINGSNHVTVSAGVFGTQAEEGGGADFNGSFNKPFSIAQLEYAGRALLGQEGAYRLYTWNNANLNVKGWGLSLDQQLTPIASVFARYGSRTEKLAADAGVFNTGWTLGGQLSGAAWGRENDRLGLAYGSLDMINDGAADEKITEMFYVVQLNDNLHLSPSVQHIGNPAGDASAKDRTVYSLRAKASF